MNAQDINEANLRLQRIAKEGFDEPVFVLRAKDINAVDTVMFWISKAEASGASQEKIDEAIEILKRFKEFEPKKVPGRSQDECCTRCGRLLESDTLFGQDDDGCKHCEDLIKCPGCNSWINVSDDTSVGGACEDAMFCDKCQEQIEITEDGPKVHEPCEECKDL